MRSLRSLLNSGFDQSDKTDLRHSHNNCIVKHIAMCVNREIDSVYMAKSSTRYYDNAYEICRDWNTRDTTRKSIPSVIIISTKVWFLNRDFLLTNVFCTNKIFEINQSNFATCKDISEWSQSNETMDEIFHCSFVGSRINVTTWSMNYD